MVIFESFMAFFLWPYEVPMHYYGPKIIKFGKIINIYLKNIHLEFHNGKNFQSNYKLYTNLLKAPFKLHMVKYRLIII